MLFGYVEDNSYNIINDDEDPILNATYYYGTNEDGARHAGWLQYTDALVDKDEDYYWFYFNTSNGKKVTAQTKNINGKKYTFDNDGIMGFKWATASFGDTTGTAWYGKLEDGALAKNQWIWNKPYGAEDGATLDSTISDNDDETQRWFRTDASGNLVKGQTKKVNSKWYAFDEDGVMRTGLLRLKKANGIDWSAAVSGATVSADPDNADMCYDMDTVTGDVIKSVTDADKASALHYFSEDEEKDGSMKTGTLKIELADDEYTFCFTKTTGAAKHGYDSSSKKIYNNGILEKADDDKYVVVENPEKKEGQSDFYLVGSTGTVVTAVNKYKDANDKYYVVLKVDDQYKIKSTYDEDIAKKAVSDKSFDKVTMTDECVSK